MQKKTSKERLFEVMGRVAPNFTGTALNEVHSYPAMEANVAEEVVGEELSGKFNQPDPTPVGGDFSDSEYWQELVNQHVPESAVELKRLNDAIDDTIYNTAMVIRGKVKSGEINSADEGARMLTYLKSTISDSDMNDPLDVKFYLGLIN